MRYLGLLLLIISSSALFAETLKFENGWARLAPPVSGMTAGYFKLTNTSKKDVTIVGAETDVSKKAEIHDMKMEKGAMSMFHLPDLLIKAGESVELRPGGKHLMIMGLNKPLKEGQQVNVTLKLADGSSHSTALPVMRKAGKSAMKDHHKHMKH